MTNPSDLPDETLEAVARKGSRLFAGIALLLVGVIIAGLWGLDVRVVATAVLLLGVALALLLLAVSAVDDELRRRARRRS